MDRIRGRSTVLAAPIALLALIGVLVATLPARGANPPTTVRLSIPGATMWLQTSVTLAAGESASITATGTISYGSGDPRCAGIPITPDGCAAETAAIPGPAGALVAKVGTGAPLIAGSSTTVTGPGRISLGVNDYETEFGNNTGAFAVTITRGIRVPLPELPPATEPNSRAVSAISTRTRAANLGGVTVTRGGQRFALTADAALQPGDVITTDAETVFLLEFSIGGRVGASPNSRIRITGDRQVEGLGGTTLVSPPPRDRPLEIQTNGGILGIRG